jgi:hypothetical protein
MPCEHETRSKQLALKIESLLHNVDVVDDSDGIVPAIDTDAGYRRPRERQGAIGLNDGSLCDDNGRTGVKDNAFNGHLLRGGLVQEEMSMKKLRQPFERQRHPRLP